MLFYCFQGYHFPVIVTNKITLKIAILATIGDNQHTPKEVSLVTINNKEIVTKLHPPLNLPSPQVDAFRGSI